VLAYAVSQRTQEIGVRMAMGAKSGDVIRMFVCQGLKLAVAGLAGGVVGAFLFTRTLSSLLFGIRPTDPIVFLVVSLVVAAVAVLASLIPSLRAIRVNPSTALRHE
jgi:putative ABC transport system permease protein